MSDEDIDYSDIPPSTPDDWVDAVRGKFYRPDTQFKEEATNKYPAENVSGRG